MSKPGITPRLISIDALRGAALFFILISNVPYAENGTETNQSMMYKIDDWIYTLWTILISRKFITIFSILFGYGFYKLMSRSSEQKSSWSRYFLIRMAVLFGIGTIHAYLLWNGDIIRTYAMCGIFLFFISHWPTKRLALLGIFLSVVLTGILFIGNSAFGWQEYAYDTKLAFEYPLAQSFERYLYINYTIDPWINFLQDMPIALSFCMGNIILGFLLGRTGFFEQSSAVPLLNGNRRWLYLAIGIVCSTLFYMINKGYLELSLSFAWLPFVIITGMMLQSLSYLSLFLPLIRSMEHTRFIRALSFVGRMPLTNYLFQSVWYLLLFFYALSPFPLYGKLGITATFALCIVLFAVQVLLSRWWLSTHKSGPVEFLWRRLLPANK